MKLLIITQVVDAKDPILGFFHRWIEEFARHCETVTVFALRTGEYALPPNVTVRGLRPDGNTSRVRTAARLVTLSYRHRSAYDAVFVHMNVEHVLAAGWLWHLLGKRIGLWYTHGTVSLRLRFAIVLAHLVFTASSQSMRVVTRKKRVMGHGMDTGALQPVPAPEREPLTFLTIGRVSPVKRIDLLIEAVALLAKDGIGATLQVAGNGDSEYVNTLRSLAQERGISGQIEFLGPVSHKTLPELYRKAHLFLHASATGSLDKASLEPVACGVPVLTTNSELAASGCPLIFAAEPTPLALKEAIARAVSERPWDIPVMRASGRAWLEEHHALERLVPSILSAYAA